MMAAAILDLNAKRSYTIMLEIFKMLRLPRNVVVLDLTYGTGRFYRKVVKEYKPTIIAVDIIKHNWEVQPSIFIQKDARSISIEDLKQYGKIDLIIVDPPWSHLKRGYLSNTLGCGKQPYHMDGVDPYSIIIKAIQLAKQLHTTLVARFMQPLPCSSIVIRSHVVIYRQRGVVYYSICR